MLEGGGICSCRIHAGGGAERGLVLPSFDLTHDLVSVGERVQVDLFQFILLYLAFRVEDDSVGKEAIQEVIRGGNHEVPSKVLNQSPLALHELFECRHLEGVRLSPRKESLHFSDERDVVIQLIVLAGEEEARNCILSQVVY